MYPTAEKILKREAQKLQDLGTPGLRSHFQKLLKNSDLSKYASSLGDIDVDSLKLILEAFSQPLKYDLREEMDKPLFKKDILSLEALRPGMVLSGAVTNVTQFGAFVDVGVTVNGLIHNSKMRGRTLSLGQKVDVTVTNVEISRKRIGLALNI